MRGILDLDNMKELIYNSSSLEDLTKRMNDSGYDYPMNKRGMKKAYIEALDYWIRIREEKLPLSSIPKRPPKKLPETVYKENETTFHLVGICHGSKMHFRRYYSSKMNELSSDVSPKKIFYEITFDKYYLSSFKSLFGSQIEPFGDTRDINLLDGLRVRFFYNVEVPLFRGYSKLRKKPLYKLANMYLTLDKKLDPYEDDDILLTIREVSKRILLPEPIHSQYESLVNRFQDKIGMKRSELMARKMLNSFAGDVYGLFGQSHEAQVEYLLKSDFGSVEIFPADLSYPRYDTV